VLIKLDAYIPIYLYLYVYVWYTVVGNVGGGRPFFGLYKRFVLFDACVQ